jgi:hypothetical protein
MFKRKIYIALILAFFVTLYISVVDSFNEGYSFLGGWFAYPLFVFPSLLLYALPVSIFSELVTKKIPIQRRFFSLAIHIGFALIFYFISPEFTIVTSLIAFVYFVLDEFFRESDSRERILTIGGKILLIISISLWIISQFPSIMG